MANCPRKQVERHTSQLQRQSLSQLSQDMVDRIDRKKVENYDLELQRRSVVEELELNLIRLQGHSLPLGESRKDGENTVSQPQHGDDCHCSKCCPNPNPTWWQRHKLGILVGILCIAIVVLAIGWSPQGGVFDAIQQSWVELFVDVFKVSVLVVVGVSIYKIIKHGQEKN